MYKNFLESFLKPTNYLIFLAVETILLVLFYGVAVLIFKLFGIDLFAIAAESMVVLTIIIVFWVVSVYRVTNYLNKIYTNKGKK